MFISWGLLTGSLVKGPHLESVSPTLKNPWMAVHIPVMFTSYSILGVAFAVAVAYLIQERQLKTKKPTALFFRLPPLEKLEGMISKLIVTAFPLLTLGIFLGGVWAHSVWGRFWSWDAKETWALITWCVYGTYLYLRFFIGWRGRKTAYVSLAGFAFVMFTYVGVNYFSPLHGFLSGR
jgi:cytochrome c-type biogenesis protein CcsB